MYSVVGVGKGVENLISSFKQYKEYKTYFLDEEILGDFSSMEEYENNFPITAVKNIKATVLNAPICPPILINKNISKAGRPINKRKNGFICLIQKYMINVYLSNYEQ